MLARDRALSAYECGLCLKTQQNLDISFICYIYLAIYMYIYRYVMSLIVRDLHFV